MGFELKDKAFFAARYARQMRTRSDKNQNELSLAEHTEKDDRDIALIKRNHLSGQPSCIFDAEVKFTRKGVQVCLSESRSQRTKARC